MVVGVVGVGCDLVVVQGPVRYPPFLWLRTSGCSYCGWFLDSVQGQMLAGTSSTSTL